MADHRDDRYPVIVEETRRYVVWVDANDAPEAVSLFNEYPSDPGADALFGFDWQAYPPGETDWYHIEHGGDGNWPGTMADAHVQVYRNVQASAARRRAREVCTAAGHPIPPDAPNGPWRWADWCQVCGRIDSAARTAVA